MVADILQQAEGSASKEANKLRAGILQAIRALGIQIGARSTTATAGAAALPSAPVGFVTLVFPDGSTGKLPFYGQ